MDALTNLVPSLVKPMSRTTCSWPAHTHTQGMGEPAPPPGCANDAPWYVRRHLRLPWLTPQILSVVSCDPDSSCVQPTGRRPRYQSRALTRSGRGRAHQVGRLGEEADARDALLVAVPHVHLLLGNEVAVRHAVLELGRAVRPGPALHRAP
jgi:hypothetical protein